MKHMQSGKEFAIVSASRAKDANEKPISDAENRRQTTMMGRAIKALGYHYIKVHGRTSELQHDGSHVHVRERSFFVPGMTKKHAIRLGRIWGQDSVIHHPAGKDRMDFKTTRKTKDNPKLGKTQFSLKTIKPTPAQYDTGVSHKSGWNKPRTKPPKPGKTNANSLRAFHFESEQPRKFQVVQLDVQ